MADFHKATKTQSYLRMALVGPSGSGKTFSSLKIAQGLGTKIALIDSERKSASKYADVFDFDALELDTSFSVEEYIDGINKAIAGGYDVLIIDSLSHAWNDKGGILEVKDAIAAQIKSENDFSAWRKVNPLQNRLLDTMLRAPLHVIVTLRTKTEYLMDKDEKGKTTITKVGTKPVQREGLEYEFDVVGDLDQANTLTVSKTRCSALTRAIIPLPNGDNPGQILKQWLTAGAPALISADQGKELWGQAKAKGLSVTGLVTLINETLHTSYSNPRECSVVDLPRVQKAIEDFTPEAESDTEAS